MPQLFRTSLQRKPAGLFGGRLLSGLALLLLLFLPQVGTAALVDLLSPQQLSRLSTEIIIIDARPYEEWQKGHIPGALSLDWRHYTQTDAQGIAYRKLASSEIALRLGAMGIDETSPLVIYGDADSSWGGEGWVSWLLSALGHVGKLYLLDGGIQAWRNQIGELTDVEPATRQPVVYSVSERPELDLETEQLEGQSRLQLVDTRSFFEWLRGSIPGAVRIDWKKFFRGAERRPLGREALITLLREHGVDPQQPIAYYCSGGIRSAYAWTVHELTGLPSAKNYEGGMAAWRQLR